MLEEIVRQLLNLRDTQKSRLRELMSQIQPIEEAIPLSAEIIVTLINSHLSLPKTSRLPVLIVAAAYQAAPSQLGEKALPLNAHNAADKQTGSLGDVEIALVTDDNLVAIYEMKDKRVTKADIDIALGKISDFTKRTGQRIDHYVFITTDNIDRDVVDYAASLYTETRGIEFVILDCVGFLRHYLHFFHRLRMKFLSAYQELVLVEPASAVNNALKETFLSLRLAAEVGVAEDIT